METLDELEALFTIQVAEIQDKVSESLDKLSHHKIKDIIPVLNRIGDETLSATEASLINDLAYLGAGYLGLATAAKLAQQSEQKENKNGS